MRHFIKYVLVTAVLMFGFHTASRFKVPSPQQSTENFAESETAALSSHPDAQPTGPDSAWQAPVAALTGTERAAQDVDRAESIDAFKRSTRQREATLEQPSEDDPFPSVRDWSSEDSPWWDQDSSDSNSERSHKPNRAEQPNNRKRASTAKDSQTSKKSKNRDRRHGNGKAETGEDKRTKRPVESARSSRETGPNDASPQQAKPAPAAPQWPIGDKLTSSSTAALGEQLRKEKEWPWQDEADTVERTKSPFESHRATEGHSQSPWNDDVDQSSPEESEPRKPEKNKQPAIDDQRLRTAEKTERHRIVDGDTLPKLAVAYLGDQDRYLDIFEANRDVLSDPRLLPIGAELAIPSGKKHKSRQSDRPSRDKNNATEWAADDGELIPIPTFALPPR